MITLFIPNSERLLSIDLSVKWFGLIKTPGSGKALTEKDPIFSKVPIESFKGTLKIGRFLYLENSYKSFRDLLVRISSQTIVAHKRF